MQPAPTTYTTGGVPAAAAGPAGGSGPGGPPPPHTAGSVIYYPVMASPTAAAATNFYDRYLHRQSIVLGVGSVVIGILCIVFNAVGMAFTLHGAQGTIVIGHGYWSGILFIITGSLGISAGKKKMRCQIIGFMVTCIFSAILAAPLLALGIIGTVIGSPTTTYDCSYQYNGYISPYRTCNETVDMSSYRVVVAMQALLAILAFIEAVLAIWGSAISCQAVCCCTPQPQTVMVPANYFGNDNQMMYINQPPPQGLAYSYTQQPTANLYQQGQMPPPAYQASYVQPTWSSPPPPPQPMPGIATVSPSAPPPVFEGGLHPPPYPSSGVPVGQSTETMKY